VLKPFFLALAASVAVVPPDSVAGTIERLVGHALPPGLLLVLYIGGALLTSSSFAFVWTWIIRPALDAWMFRSFVRRSVDYERHMREHMFANDQQRLSNAIELARTSHAHVEAQRGILETFQGLAAQMFAMVTDMRKDVSDLRQEIRDVSSPDR
jgi:hypothetical protein